MAHRTPRVRPTYWQCCQCNGGPFTYALTSKCTEVNSNNKPCQHAMCNNCLKDNNIPPPLTSARPRARASSRFESVRHARNLPAPAAIGQTQEITQVEHNRAPRFRLTSGQPMNFWKCHNCHHVNNPVLNPNCLRCQHIRCRFCTLVRPNR